MAFTDYLENKLLAHTFSNTAYTSPGTVYVALYTVAPTDSSVGTEVTGGGYVRQSASFTTTASTNKTISTGDVFRIPTGDLDITLN